MRRLVSAMVIVVPPSRFEAMRQLSVETVFGVPGGIFATVDDALEWAEAADHLTAETVTAAQNIVNPFHTI